MNLTAKTEMARLDKILAAAKARMDAAPYSPHIVYAEIFFMTDAESIEFFQLRRLIIDSEKKNDTIRASKASRLQVTG